MAQGAAANKAAVQSVAGDGIDGGGIGFIGHGNILEAKNVFEKSDQPGTIV